MNLQFILDNLAEGDILLVSEYGFIHRMIQLVTRSKWNHVMLFLKVSHTPLLVGASPTVNIAVFDQYLLNSCKDVKILRPNWNSNEQRDVFINEVLDHINDKYDYEGVVAFLIRCIIPNFRWQSKRKFFCSELLATALEVAGYHWTDKPAHLLAPADFDSTEFETIPVV